MAELTRPDRFGGVTLVALLGDKPPALDRLVTGLGERLTAETAGRFRPYDRAQVHATLVGLEGVREAGRIHNRNFLELREERRTMDLPALLAAVRSRLPLTLQIGGFTPGRPYPFASRGEHPYRRSFCLRGSTAVAMGWPVDDGDYPDRLDDLRRAASRAGALHKYHAAEADVDNDFFFVLGQIDGPTRAEATQETLRREMAERDPLLLTIDAAALRVVAYRDPRLPAGEVRTWPLGALEAHADEILEAAAPDPRETLPA